MKISIGFPLQIPLSLTKQLKTKRDETLRIKKHKHRKMVEALNPRSIYSINRGYNPFSYLLASLQSKAFNEVKTEEERHLQRQLKMKADQKSAKSRQNRKRNKV